jgi:Alginate export
LRLFRKAATGESFPLYAELTLFTFRFSGVRSPAALHFLLSRTHPVLIRPNTFAIPDHTQSEWGAGFTRAQETEGWSGYYFALNHKVDAFNGKAGHEICETVGSRIWNQGKIFDYADFIIQFGSFANGHILAGAISSNDGFSLRKLKCDRALEFVSLTRGGDSNRSSNNLNTFNPLFPNPMYSSLSVLLGPSNLTDLVPTIRLTLDSKTAITPEMPVYWRSSIHDGIYNFATILIRPGNLTSARFVGYQPGLVVEHIFSHNVSRTVGYFHFFAGNFLKQTPPAENVGYFYATGTFRF